MGSEGALRTWLLALIYYGASATAAQAQEPDLFRLDAVFVSVFRSADESLEPRARALEARLVRALSERHLVVDVGQVPAFEDYSAEIYLLSCPIEQDPGCAYVIASRGQADWAVSGVLSRTADGEPVLTTTLVDVGDARSVVQFEVPLDEGDSTSYAVAVANLVDQLAAATPASDPDKPLPEGSTDAERAAIAASLGQLEVELGELEIRNRDTAMEAPKLSDEDIARLQGQESGPPWQRMGLSASQYRRMQNRGFNLTDWRARLRGRQGRVLLRASLGGGSGPFGVAMDGRWVIDPSVGDVVRREVFQEVVPAAAFGAGLEAAVGLTPWLDMGVSVQSTAGSLTYTLHAETLGDARVPNEPTTTPAGALYVGGVVTFAPLPAAELRPLIFVGAGQWFGPGLGRAIDVTSVPNIEVPPAPRVFLFRAGPGIEVEASREVQLFARVEAVVPISGHELVQYASGPEELEYPGSPSGPGGVGVGGAVGVQVSLGPLWSGVAFKGRRPRSDDDEEPELDAP